MQPPVLNAMRRKMHQLGGIRILLHILVPEINLRLLLLFPLIEDQRLSAAVGYVPLLLFLLIEDQHLSAAVGYLF